MKTLGSVKVKEEVLDNIDRSIILFNKNNLVQITKQEFRRMSYDLLSQLILTDQLDTITKVVNRNS